MRYVANSPTSSGLKTGIVDAGPRFVAPAGEWRDMRAVQGSKASRLPTASDSPAVDGHASAQHLKHSITSKLRGLGALWENAASGAFERNIASVSSSGNYRAFDELTDFLATHGANTLPGIDELIARFENAIDTLPGADAWKTQASQSARGSHTLQEAFASIGRKLLPDTRNPELVARTAPDVLLLVDRAMDGLLLAVKEVQALEAARVRVQGLPLSEEALHAQSELRQVYVKAGAMLQQLDPIINHCLTQAEKAIPKEKRRLKTKIAIVVLFALITTTLGIATLVAPPSAVALAAWLKGVAIVMGVLTAGNGIYGLTGYARPPAWGRLAGAISEVRNLHQSISRGLNARQQSIQLAENLRLCNELTELQTDLTRSESNQRAIHQKLDDNEQMTRL